jgi:hypothetical protein
VPHNDAKLVGGTQDNAVTTVLANVGGLLATGARVNGVVTTELPLAQKATREGYVRTVLRAAHEGLYGQHG